MIKPETYLLLNIGQCITMSPSKEGGGLGLIREAAIAVHNSVVVWVGPEKKLPNEYREFETRDAMGALVSPGLIDCHTHAIFAGSRADEFFARASGKSYEEIAKQGGGIARTVETTRAATDAELIANTERRLKSFYDFGVTTVEIKSGYGLSTEHELRLLRLLKQVKSQVQIIPTFLGAHTFPKELKSNRNEYIRILCEEMIPNVVKEKLSNICDIFCDNLAFSIEEARVILKAAKKQGMHVKLHADQLSSTGGAELAAELSALSADHLEHVSDAGVSALAKSGTVGVLLPGAVFFAGKKHYPNARRLMEAGVNVALSTDCNPGTCHTQNLPLMMTFAALELKMTVEEIWKAVTTNAARALGETKKGRIAPSLKADFTLWDAQVPEDLAYGFGSVRRIIPKR